MSLNKISVTSVSKKSGQTTIAIQYYSLSRFFWTRRYLHVIYDFFRKDNIIFALCICITITGSLVIIIKKIISRQSIQRIPKSNILPQPTNDQEQSFQMATLHSTPRIIQVQPINEYDSGDWWKEANATTLLCSPAVFPNNTKHNKNIFSLYGIFVISLSISITLGLGISSRFGWVTVSNAAIYFFFHFCLFPVLLPTVYFMKNPKHLISVLQDHNLPWIKKFWKLVFHYVCRTIHKSNIMLQTRINYGDMS